MANRADIVHQTYMDNFQNILEPGHVPIMTKEYKPKVVQKFDKYLTPDELKKYVYKSEKIQQVIEYYANKLELSKRDVQKKVKEIIDEIALGRSLPIIRWLGMCITAVSKRICSAIYVNEANLNKVKEQLGRHPVLYLPSHRSYCDFILMSYICFHYDIEIPGIAAGMDFQGMFGMGHMLRKTGAFFMRRSFSGDDLYWDVFKKYVDALVTVYHIGVEFFIEGTRSRNFKALTPKIGLLSMALQSLFMGDVPDITIIPIGVSYDRLLEEQLFVYELLGVPKPKESTKGFLKALKIVDERFGRMYLDFGEPISVKQFFGNKLNRVRHANISSKFQKLEKEEIQIIKDLANEVVYQQQRHIVLTTFNLIAFYFAYKSYLGYGINLEQLSNGVLLLKNIFEYFGAHIATEEKSVKMDIIESIEIHQKILKFATTSKELELVRSNFQYRTVDLKRLKGHQLSEQIMQMSVPLLSLQLYINPCMFWVSIPSLMVLSAMKLSTETSGNIQKDQLRIRMEELISIFSNEFVLILEKKDEHFIKSIDFLTHFKIFEITDRIKFIKNEISEILLSSIAPFLCCYYQLIETILEEFYSKEFTEKELLIANQKRIEKLLIARDQYTHPYCLSLDNLSIALSSLVQNSFMSKRKESAIFYLCKQEEILNLKNVFLQYCQLLPFNYYENVSVLSKL